MLEGPLNTWANVYLGTVVVVPADRAIGVMDHVGVDIAIEILLFMAVTTVLNETAMADVIANPDVLILQKPILPNTVTLPVQVQSPAAGLVPIFTLLKVKTRIPDLDQYL